MKTIKIRDKEGPVKLEWLRSFLAVVDHGGFTRAAKAIRLSQPAVSTQVKELERALDTSLFDQAGGRIRLTETGKMLATEARRIVDLVHDLHGAVSEAGDAVRGTLSLAASTTPGNYLLPDIMAAFERRYPQARTTLLIGNTSQVLERLHANEADLGFVGLKPDDREFFSRAVFDDEIVPFAAAGHPLARARRVTLPELFRERIILREAASATRRLCDRWIKRHRLRAEFMEVG